MINITFPDGSVRQYESGVSAFDIANSRLEDTFGGGWVQNKEYDIEFGNNYIINHTGYFAICGAKGCIRACMNMLEKTDRIENKFHNNFYYKKTIVHRRIWSTRHSFGDFVRA